MHHALSKNKPQPDFLLEFFCNRDMIVRKQPYNPPTQNLFLDQNRKMGLIKKMKKQINKFETTGEDLGIVTTMIF
jgi:hypothetical protein